MTDSLVSRRVLIWKELDSPECLVLDFLLEIWSSWGHEPVLERSNFDVSNREVIVTGSGRATGLTVDSDRKLLLWTDQDGLRICYTALVSPGEVGTLHQSGHSYALTSFRSQLYRTDWTQHILYKAALLNSTVEMMTPSSLKTGMDYVMDIVVYSTLPADQAKLSSPCDDNKCQYLCVVKQGRPSCLCPSHYSL